MNPIRNQSNDIIETKFYCLDIVSGQYQDSYCFYKIIRIFGAFYECNYITLFNIIFYLLWFCYTISISYYLT